MKLTTYETKLLVDLLYDQMVRVSDNYRHQGVTRAEQKRLRVERRRIARIVNKLEGREVIDEKEEP